ncbi:MAG: hypothetical protein EOO15_09485 [Chitinophagaceae bacterium]|nr:MAG: hypothetical protein EOO15_09485 [Chitinophagaceae bacterium]
MDPELDMEMQLWAYIDGLSEESERNAVERLIAENAAWRTRYAELLDTHRMLQQSELEEPSMRFTRNVMETIASTQIVPASRQYLNNRIIGGIGLFFGALLLLVLVLAFKDADWNSGGNGESFFPQFNLQAAFGNSFVNLFLMGNIVLGILLLDRVLSAKRAERLAKVK